MIKQFAFHELDIPGAFLIEPFCATDERGEIVKDYSREVFTQNRIAFEVIETLYITSRQNVLRGLHFQRLKPQPKLLRCINGCVWVVAVDLRKDGKTVGKWVTVELAADAPKALYVPSGCALGTLAFQDSLLSCKCGEKLYPEYGDGIRWDDAHLKIEWPIERLSGAPIVSDKDLALGNYLEYLKNEKES